VPNSRSSYTSQIIAVSTLLFYFLQLRTTVRTTDPHTPLHINFSPYSWPM